MSRRNSTDLGLVEPAADPPELVLDEDLHHAAAGRHAAPDRRSAAHRPSTCARPRLSGVDAVPDAGAGTQPSCLTSARIFAGSGRTPRAYRSANRTMPCPSITNVAR